MEGFMNDPEGEDKKREQSLYEKLRKPEPGVGGYGATAIGHYSEAQLRILDGLQRGLQEDCRKDDENEIMYDVERADGAPNEPIPSWKACLYKEKPNEYIHNLFSKISLSYKLRILSTVQVSFDQAFAIANLLLELVGEILNQMSSKRQPHLGLVVVLFSLTTLLVCIIELIYRRHKERVAGKKNDMITWIDLVALSCSILQCVFASIAYAFLVKHGDDPIKLSIWPIFFAAGVVYSKFHNKTTSGFESKPNQN